MPDASPTPSRPKWNAVVLVCKACGKRSKGPRHLKAKALVTTLRSASKDERPRPRIVTTGCLGLCPKRAIAVAFVGGQRESRIVAVASSEQLASLYPAAMAG